MKFPLLLLSLSLGFWSQAQGNSIDRSKRGFRLDAQTGVVYADLVVAYEDPPTTAPLGGLTTSAFLKQAFQNASLELFTASKGAVQLGQVTVIPASFATNGSAKSDPDVILLADPSLTTCPGNLLRPEEALPGNVLVCADANTGGYLGLSWWLPTAALPGVTDPVFARNASSSQGARIAVGWNTLATYGAKVLVHEFGHYLFAMRDEYQGPIFNDIQAFGSANSQDPSKFSGVALTGGDIIQQPQDRPFKGYGMGLLSEYSATQGYSSKFLPTTGVGAAEWAAFPGKLEENLAVTEQIASVATRGGIGSVSARYGGMWSLETAIRTGLNANSATPVNYTPVVLPTSAHNSTTEAQVSVYGTGQANIFLFDRSGSMANLVTGSKADSVTKWDVAVDFFGRLTHPDALDTSLRYPTNARFGFTGFDIGVVDQVVYPSTLGDLKTFTVPYVPEIGSVDKQLAWASNPANPMPEPRLGTNLVEALGWAQKDLDDDLLRPFQRNVILISDGLHNFPDSNGFTGDEGLNGNYRVFSIAVDTKLDDQGFGTKMQNLAKRSVGPEGVNGLAYFTNGDNTTGQLTQAANDILNAINAMDLQSIAPSLLYRDAAQEFATQTDSTQKLVQFALSWAGSVAPLLSLTLPNGQILTEGNGMGISFRQGKNFKAFDVDLTKFPLGSRQSLNQWKLRATAPTASPITIFPSVATKSSRLQVNVSFDPRFVNSTGRLPVTVLVQDGRPIEGLVVSASLSNRATGVIQRIPLAWNGASYTGAISGRIQPGQSDLSVNVGHPQNGKVFFAPGENRIPDALRTPYPSFAPRQQSQQVWVDGAAKPKSLPGLEVWTTSIQPNSAQGTTLKLFVKNGTPVPLMGLKVRYFYSVSEFANGVPSVNVNYLPQSKATVGTVTGRPGLAYVQFDFGTQTLPPGTSTSNGTNGGEGVTVIESQWRSPWNTTNDWSAQGLATTWAANPFVNVYDASGRLISGNPDLEPVEPLDNAQPIVSLVPPNLVAVGTPVRFVAHAVDPEGDSLTYAWTVDGAASTPSPGAPNQIVFTFGTAGAHTVNVVVRDGHSPAVLVSVTVVVQPASGACTEANTRDLGAASTNSIVSLSAGANCLVIQASALPREWKWSNVVFQANSDNGVVLTGLSVQAIPTGTPTNLSGYSQTVPFADPTAASVYLKVQSPTARLVRLAWWVQ